MSLGKPITFYRGTGTGFNPPFQWNLKFLRKQSPQSVGLKLQIEKVNWLKYGSAKGVKRANKKACHTHTYGKPVRRQSFDLDMAPFDDDRQDGDVGRIHAGNTAGLGQIFWTEFLELLSAFKADGYALVVVQPSRN